MGKSKFNKRKCMQCTYHRGIKSTGGIYCNYGCITDQTCLTKGEDGKIYDRRGDDYNDCKLFVRGDKIIERKEPILG